MSPTETATFSTVIESLMRISITCTLAVLSGMEIDKAKRLYAVDSAKVLSRLRHYRQNYKKNHGGNLPAFYKYIVGDESPDVGENNAHLDAPMAFVHDAVDAFPGRAAYSKTIPLSELFDLDATDAGANDTHKKQNIIETVKEAHTRIAILLCCQEFLLFSRI